MTDTENMDKDQYRNIEDFLKDETFFRWVREPDSEAAEVWESWLARNPEKAALVNKAALVVKGVKFTRESPSESLVKTELARLNRRLDRLDNKNTQTKSGPESPGLGIWWKIAASVAFLVVATYGVYQWYWNHELVYSTDFGERLELELMDGTEVVVNANSSIRFIRNEPREVRMEGEVYFNVDKRHETGETFRVITPDLNIEVLGTVFNVNSRHERTEVVLQEGSVKLRTQENDSLMMHPGERVTYSSTDKQIINRELVKPEIHTSWKNGMLMFENKPLKNVLSHLQDIYGIEVVYEDAAIADKIMDGGIPNDSLELCIRTLRKLYGLDIELRDTKLIIK